VLVEDVKDASELVEDKLITSDGGILNSKIYGCAVVHKVLTSGTFSMRAFFDSLTVNGPNPEFEYFLGKLFWIEKSIYIPSQKSNLQS
jgi:hypothetical protein